MKINELTTIQRFMKFPQALITDEKYNKLSPLAKIMYTLLHDRANLSIQNNWVDENGDVYQYYTIEQFMVDLQCSKTTTWRTKKELVEFGLIKEQPQGANKPNKIYVLIPDDFGSEQNKNDREGGFKNEPQEVSNLNHGGFKNEPQEVSNLNPIKTNISRLINQTNIPDSPSLSKQTINNIYIGLLDLAKMRLGKEAFSQSELDRFRKDTREATQGNKDQEELIKEAINIAGKKGANSWNYVSTILKNWRSKGIKSLEDLDERERKHKEDKLPEIEDWMGI